MALFENEEKEAEAKEWFGKLIDERVEAKVKEGFESLFVIEENEPGDENDGDGDEGGDKPPKDSGNGDGDEDKESSGLGFVKALFG